MDDTRYPNFDVMDLAEEWDDHTRQIIEKRMEPPQPLQFFTQAEGDTLVAAIARLVADSDPWRVGKVLEHIDGTLAHNNGEGYRPEWQPEDKQFWRLGVSFLGPDFAGAPADSQDQMLRDLQAKYPDFFKALLKETVTGYCSLPPVWSQMGYGGPAFPRGYVRIELGLRDPWEAKQHVQ